MAWSIVEVARMARVTSRTLRHYDAIGLLPPASVGANGYRRYEREQLLRLQQILLLRELGLDLATIAGILAGDRDRVDELRRHEEWLRGEGERLERLADTVARTVTHLERGTDMAAPDLFDGFADRRAEAEESLVARYGEDVRGHFATARERTKDWTAVDYADARAEGDAVDDRLVALMAAGVPAGDPRTFEVIEEHHRLVTAHWTPDRASYTGLGQLYVDDPRFRERYDARAPGLAEYLRDAIAAYARERLA